MSTSPPESDVPRPDNSGERPPEAKPEGRSLAKRVASRTTDFVAIAFVLIAGLSMGRTAIEWWNTEPAPVSADLSAIENHQLIPPDWQAGGQPVTIGIGNSPVTIERRQLSGRYEQIRDELLRQMQQRTKEAKLPASAADERELSLVDALSRSQPVAETDDGVRIDHVDGPLNLFVGTRLDQSNDTDRSARRIVGWGLAFPSGDDVWTAYFFTPEGSAAKSPEFDWNAMLPNDARRTLSLSTVDGATLFAFEGAGEIGAWERELEERFSKAGFDAERGWKQTGPSHAAIFAAERDSGRIRVEITLSFSAESHITGLFHATVVPHEGQSL